jgi:6-phosphogluconolactonase (cycloisomerase 2 family)
MRRLALLGLAAALLVSATTVLARGEGSEPRARVTQLADRAGCLQDRIVLDELLDDDEPECTISKALAGTAAVVVTADGRQVYVAAAGSDAITWLSRNGDTGEVAFAGCLSDDGGTGTAGTDGQCTDGDSIDSPRAVALSPDGTNLYAAAAGSGSVLSFSRNGDTGQLAQLGCIKDYVDEGRCVDQFALGGVRGIAVAPDGRDVYAVASGSDSVVTLQRDTSTGRLTFGGCISDDGTNGRCTDGEALRGASNVAISPDGASVYVAATNSSAIVSFRRDDQTGALTQTGCELNNAPPGPCDRASALAGASSVAVAADGRTVFATAAGSGSLTAFRRDAGTGTLSEASCTVPQPAEGSPCTEGGPPSPSAVAVGAASGELLVTSVSGGVLSFAFDPGTAALTRTGCVSSFENEGCIDGRGLVGASQVAVSPDGRSAYVAAPESNAVAIFAEAAVVPARSAVVRRGVVRIPVTCPRRAAGGCRGELALAPRRAGGRVVRGFRLRAGRSSSFAVRLTPRSVRGLARHRRLRAIVTVRERGRALPAIARDFVLEAGR